MSMASSSYSAPEASSSGSWTYDVFLSFRGEDTRKTFVDHLYSALSQRLIRTYKDAETLPRGESIGPFLLKAIEESKIAVIIFSEKYAESSWCLEELAHIMKCKDERELIVMPVFYDVDPSDVRKQKGKFGEAFARHGVESITKAESWRKALVDASKVAGWEPKNIANGHESTVIKRIVDTILDRLLSLTSEADENLIGIKARVQSLKARLKVGSGGVCMVGIWGVGGGGKTTLANSACMEISHHFEGHYVVENIREESRKYGLKKLQENILSAIIKDKAEVHSVADGKSKLKRVLCHSKVLVLLDDVDDACQLEALAGSHSWFGSGSRIIITTRNEHLLRTHKVNEVCPVRLLSNEEAIQLFNKRAFNEKMHVKDYETLSLNVVSYAAGLPLALKVLGSFLYDKDKKEWMSTLARLKDIPETKILEQLKISYDGLENVEKELFLDIACFFRWESTKTTHNNAMEILEACGFYPDIGIKVLRQKALINIVDDRFDMHDLVQEMGHYIVRGEHPNNPEKHSRVWKPEEINDMCLGNVTMVNDKTEAIMYCTDDTDAGLRLMKIVSNMKKLRWLSLSTPHGDFVEGPKFLSNELRFIQWTGYPASPFPENFQPLKLVVLIMYNSWQYELWKDYKRLPHLKVLKLIDMKRLLETPDFDELPCLQKLTIYDCMRLLEIHPSLGNHRCLEYVNVSSCIILKKFPTIVRMQKLETLKIVGCEAIFEFPEIQGNMGSLVNLYLGGNGIEVLPSLIGVCCTPLLFLSLVSCSMLKRIDFNFHDLEHLKEFKYNDSRPMKMPLLLFQRAFTQLPSNLRKLDFGGCHFKDGEIPSHIGELSNMQELDLTWNDFTRLDFSLLRLTRLKLLKLDYCRKLVKLPELPSSIAILTANGCNTLRTLGDNYKCNKWLWQVSIMDGGVVTDGSRLLESMIQGNAIENHSMVLRLQGLEIAKGFTPPLLRGNRCRLQLPENWSNNFSGFLFCGVIGGFDSSWITMKQVTSDTDSEDEMVWEESDNGYYQSTLVWYASFGSMRHTTWWDETYKAVSFSIDSEDNGHSFSLDKPKLYSGFGVRLVGGSRTSTTQEESEFSQYTPKVHILHDSQNALHVWFRSNSCATVIYPGLL